MTQDTGDRSSEPHADGGQAGAVADVDAVASVGEGVYRLDAEGHFVEVNDVVLDLTGYERDALLGEHVSIVVAEEDIEAFEVAIRALLESDEDDPVGDLQFEFETATGEQVVCEARFAVVERDGRFEGTVGVVRDVTERVRDAEAVRRQRAQLRSELDEVLGRVSDAFFALDAEKRFTYVNERAGELLNRDAEALLGEHVSDEFTEAEATPFVEDALRAMESGEQVTFEEFHAHHEAWFEVRFYPGESGVSVYVEDVTDRKHREAVLEQYETVVETVEDGLYAIDEGYRFTFVNEAYCRLTGYDREDLVGEHISKVVDEETLEESMALRDDLLAGDGEAGSVEVEIERADGESVTVESSYAVVSDDDEFRGTVGVVRDVTERKAFEETLAALHEASRELHVAETPDDVALIVLGTLTDVLGLPAATLFRRDEDDEMLVPEHQTSAAVDSGQELPPLPPEEGSLTGHVLSLGEFRAYDDIRETSYLQDPKTEMRAGLIAPLDEDRVLVVSSSEPGAFDERSERLVEILAGNATAALKRQEREREHRESERRYRTLVDNFPNGAVALYDEECHYVAVGGQMYDRIDLSPKDAVGMTVGERLSGEIAEALESMILQAFEGESEEFEVRYDGRDFWLQSIPIRDDDGDVIVAMVVTQDVTERKQAEEALEESERRFRTMMEQSPLSTQIFDPDGNTVMVNPAWERLWGASSEDVGEYNVLEDEQLEEKGLLPYLERGFDGEATQLPPVYYDPEEIGKEGRPRWIEAFVYPIFDEAGDIREVALIHNDVTERMEHERELERYETIVETVDDGVYVTDDDGRIAFVNETFAELSGYDREELVGTDASALTADEYASEIADVVRRLEEGEESVATVETEIVTVDGERRPVETRVTLFPLDDGVHGRVGVVRDIAERKERERELERYETAVDTASDAVITIDGQSTIRDVNPAVVEMFGYEPDELLGEPLTTLMPERMREQHEDALDRYLETGDPQLDWEYVELPGEHRDGHEIPLAISFGEFTYDGERYFTGIIRDNTERKERERELAEQRERYRGLVESAPVPIATYDAEGQLTYANDAAVDLISADGPDDLVGEPAIEFIHPDDRAETAERMRRVIEEREPAPPRETMLVDLDGEVRYAIIASAPITREGAPGGQVVLSNVTERKEYERRLAESEQRYRTLVEHFPNGAVTLYDRDLQITAIGGDIYTDIDESVEGAEGITIEERVGPDLFERLEPSLRRALDGESDQLEIHVDGRGLWVHTLPVRSDDGEVLNGVVMVQDITERKEQERTLERFQTIIETVDDGVYTIDSEGYITMANTAYAEMTGYDREELIGMHGADLVDESVHDRARELEAELARGETSTARLVADLDTADGRPVTAEATFALLPGDDEAYERVAVVRDVTERFEREAELERALGLLERTETIADVGGWEIDTGTTEVFWSEHLFDILETPFDEEPPLEEALDVYHPDDRPIVEKAVEEALSSGEPFDIEVRFLTASDEVRWIRVQGVPEVVDGEIVSLRGAAQDVTERVEREEELERALDLLERTETIADVGGWELDPETQDVFWTEHTFDLQGIPYGDEPPLEEALDVYHPDDQPIVEEAIEEALSSGEPIDIEVRYIPMDDDEVRWLRLQGVPEVVDDEVVSLRGAAQDVTERVEYERELKQYEVLFEESTDVNAVIDPDGTYRYLTPSVTNVLGYDQDELVGEVAFDYIHPEDRDLAMEEFGKLLENPEHRPAVEIRFQHKDGSWVDLDARANNLLDEPDVGGIVAYTRDISELKERERELQTRVEQQAAVADLGKRALEIPDLEELFDEAVEVVAETLDNEFAKVLELQPDGETLRLRGGVGWRDGLVGEATVGTGDDSQAGHTLRTEEPIVVTDLETETRFSGPELLTSHGVRSGISTIIGSREDPWGVLGTHDDELRTFGRHDVVFVQTVANILATAIDRRNRERMIEEQRNQMASIVRLSEVVQEVDQAVIRQSTREEIEELTCDMLAEGFAAAWLGDVNVANETIIPRASAGLPSSALEPMPFLADDSGDVRDPTALAVQARELRIAHRPEGSAGEGSLPEFARERGFRSAAAVPIAFEDIQYGVLTVFSDREDAFEGYEGTLIEQLGATVGHAINAIDRKQALVSDAYTQLEIRLPDQLALLDLPETATGDDHHFEIDGTVSAGDGTVVQYVTVSGLSPETFREAAMEMAAVSDVRSIGGEEGQEHRFEVTYDDPPLSSTLASYGGRIESVHFDVPDLRIVVAIPQSTDVRKIVDAIRSDFPETRVDAQRTVIRDEETTEEHRRTIEEDLTERQRAALLTSYFAGYFEWSRESTGEEVAETLGISPSTFHQHLRTAQRKVFSSLFGDESPS